MREDADLTKQKEGPKAAWMVTFADLVSLMLTFFVLLFSMSSVKMDDWEAITDTLTQSLNPSKVTTVAAATAEFNIGTIFRRQATDLDYLAGVLESGVAEDELLKNAKIMQQDDRLIIALPGDLLFPPGKAGMPDEARSALFTLGSLLRNVGNQIGVNGHTDPTPPGEGSGYASNWELSVARAAAVANTLRQSGYTDDIVAYGFADSHYNLLPEMTQAERDRLGRRVDIVVFPTVGGGA
ncbi:MAG: flagellar motor protein MotB [Alphaproteobacteria bacterium]|nr:flagellar motor protein MotB [Alphaproteobacteria bacterium]MBF0250858.1 flagellar motor protein MotB [Alphaproteobacteria bacterium]